MSWRLAYSLEILRSQVNAAYPERSTASDGTIGDVAHQAVPSDHNPNAAEVVTALDLTHDPAHGMDSYALADRLLAVRHPDLKYLISNRRIAGAWTNWQWAAYSGTSDPHTNHVHISVGVGDDGQSRPPYDDSNPWNVTNKEVTMPNEGDVHNAYQKANKRNATPQEVKIYTSRTWNAPDGLVYGKIMVDWGNAITAANRPPTGMKPLGQEVYVKE